MLHPRYPAAAFALLLALVWPSAAVLEAQDAPRTAPKAKLDESITAEQLLTRVAFLSSDELAGRETGTNGGRATEEYVAQEFRRLGLAPLPGRPADTFRVPVELPGRTPLAAESTLEVLDAGGGAVQTYHGTDGALPFSFSAVGTVEGGVAFVGFGLVDAEESFDEYAGVDVRGKVVVVLRHGPRENDPASPWSLRSREGRAKLSFLAKAKAAEEAGAVGVLLVNDANHDHDRLPVTVPGEPVSIPMAASTRAAVNRLLEPTGRTLAELQAAIEAELEPQSFVLPDARVRLTAALSDASGANVVGYLEGSDPKLRKEVVLVGAHLDHVGRGFFGSLAGPGEIHNGADDNASGTSALLEIAEALVAGERPRRSLVLAGWCAEEKGLIGSRAFVQSPPLALDRIVACLNLDMVGRYGGTGKLEPLVNVGGASTGEGLEERLLAAAATEELTVAQSWEAWPQSDHIWFYRSGVPSLFFHTGMHADYHRPGDDWWKVDADGAAAIARMVQRLTLGLANADQRPTFVERPPTPVLGVRLGEGDGGVLIGQVFPGYGAAAAGMARGDVVVEADGEPVRKPSDLSRLIQSHAVGDKLHVVVRRGARRLELEVELKAAR